MPKNFRKEEFDVERHPYTGLVIYEVSLDDLNRLEKETLSVSEDFAFALFFAATAISFTITLATVNIPAGKLYDTFLIVMLFGYAGALFFGIKWFKGRHSFKSVVKEIKERPGTLGEEGKEIDSEELENLPEKSAP
jgi:hypothetical protein